MPDGLTMLDEAVSFCFGLGSALTCGAEPAARTRRSSSTAHRPHVDSIVATETPGGEVERLRAFGEVHVVDLFGMQPSTSSKFMAGGEPRETSSGMI